MDLIGTTTGCSTSHRH